MKNHIGNNLKELSTIDLNGRRYYITPEGNKYPSVTTVLDCIKDKKTLENWKKRIGEDEANRITKYSTDIGTSLHETIEKYLTNENWIEHDAEKNFSIHKNMMFKKMKDKLEKIDNIHALEAPLYSNVLKMGGRTDCIAEYDGTLSIIDFKTSRKEKKEEWIENYFIQGSIYSLMYEELTGIKIPQVVILLTTYGFDSCIWIKKRKDYFPKIKNIVENIVPELLL